MREKIFFQRGNKTLLFVSLLILQKLQNAAIAQLEERGPAKLEVAGSSPAGCTIKSLLR